jgi:hypothetical protein
MTEIRMVDYVGNFAENKDIARDLRKKQILPKLNKNEVVVLNFENVDGATQSFVHALISDVIRKHGIDVLDSLIFKNCNNTIKQIVSIVVEYMQEK